MLKHNWITQNLIKWEVGRLRLDLLQILPPKSSFEKIIFTPHINRHFFWFWSPWPHRYNGDIKSFPHSRKKEYKRGFCDTIEEPFWVSQRTFQWTVLLFQKNHFLLSIKNILIIWITLFHYKESSFHWKYCI